MDNSMAPSKNAIFTNTRHTKWREPVTVAEWDRRPGCLDDETAYWFNKTAHDAGFECWATIDGVDPDDDGINFDVWFASGRNVAVTGDKVIYVKPEHAALLALALSMAAPEKKGV